MNNYPQEAISKILAPALGLWLKTQTNRLDELQIKISGRNRQIISGLIPKVSLASHYVVYQGLHLRQVQLESENISINIGQIIGGHSLRLLKPIQVTAKVLLTESALEASLLSPLLSQALADLLLTCIERSLAPGLINILKDSHVSWQKASLNSDKLALLGTLRYCNQSYDLSLRSGLSLKNYHTLSLQPLQIETRPKLISLSLHKFDLHLGADVKLAELKLSPHQIACSGQIIVRS
ncbi:MAG: DUF2993 domain-containing protein [Cyanophyceae cyanobacterium]